MIVGFALPRSAWGGGFALGLLIRWVWVFAVVGWVFVVVGLGLCRGGGLVDSVVGWVFAVVGLGLCRGLGWLNRWLGVVVGSPEVELGLKVVEQCRLVAEKILVAEINLTVGYFWLVTEINLFVWL